MGGLIQEALASDPEREEELLWDALLLAEQAAALEPNNADALSHLVRRHLWLDHPATAMATAERAVELLPNASGPARERVVALASIGDPDALAALERYESYLAAGLLPPDPGRDPTFPYEMRGYVFFHQASSSASAAFLDRSLPETRQAGPRSCVRVPCRLLPGDHEGARADAQRVLGGTTPGRAERDCAQPARARLVSAGRGRRGSRRSKPSTRPHGRFGAIRRTRGQRSLLRDSSPATRTVHSRCWTPVCERFASRVSSSSPTSRSRSPPCSHPAPS